MLLILNGVYLGKISAQVARDLHQSKAWASNWLKRYDDEGIEGLKDRPKSGRHLLCCMIILNCFLLTS